MPRLTAYLLVAERVLLGARASVFDHGSHGLHEIHRRLRRNLCWFDGDTHRVISGATAPPRVGGANGTKGGEGQIASVDVFHEAHQWEEEAPQAQLNGGSDPVVITVTHAVYHGSEGFVGDGGGVAWEDGSAPGPRPDAVGLTKAARSDRLGAPDPEGSLESDAFPLGRSGREGKRVGGVMLRVRAYNATNARLHGFVIRLAFGQGVNLARADTCGRVEACVDEVRAQVR